MKKGIALFLTCALLFCGCNSNSSENSNDISSDASNNSSVSDTAASGLPNNTGDYITLKYGYFDHKILPDDKTERIEAFNRLLHEKGYGYSIEPVLIYYEDFSYYDEKNSCIDYEKAITDYEEKNGTLDFFSLGNEGMMGLKGGPYYEGICYHLVEKGFFEPIDIENSPLKDLFPETLWDTVRINGKVYGIPYISVNKFEGLSFYLNSDHFSQKDIDKFDGSLGSLVDIIIDMSLPEINKSLCGLDQMYVSYEFNDAAFLKNASSYDFDFQHSLIFDYKTMKAVNPFEYRPFIEWTRALNKAVNAELINRGTNLAVYASSNQPNYADETQRRPYQPLSFINAGKLSSKVIEANFQIKAEKMVEFVTPAYIENQLANSDFIRSASQKKDDVFKLFDIVAEDEEIKLAAREAGVLYFTTSEEKEELKELEANGRLLISPFAGFRLNYSDAEEYWELQTALQEYYSELGNAEDFDSKLEEIRTKLKEAGIDDYVNKVNGILEEKGFTK